MIKFIFLFLFALCGVSQAQLNFWYKKPPATGIWAYERLNMHYSFDVTGATDGAYTFRYFFGAGGLGAYTDVAVSVASGIATPSNYTVLAPVNGSGGVGNVNEYLQVKKGAVVVWSSGPTTWKGVITTNEIWTGPTGEILFDADRSIGLSASSGMTPHTFTLKNQCSETKAYQIKVGGYVVGNGIIGPGSETAPGTATVTVTPPSSYAGAFNIKMGSDEQFQFEPNEGVNASTWWINTVVDCPTCCGEEGGADESADPDNEGSVDGEPIGTPDPPPPNPDGTGSSPGGASGPPPPTPTPPPTYTPSGGPPGPNDDTQDIYAEVKAALLDASHEGTMPDAPEETLTDGTTTSEDRGRVDDVTQLGMDAQNAATNTREGLAAKIAAFSGSLSGLQTSNGSVSSVDFATFVMNGQTVNLASSLSTGMGSIVPILRAIVLYGMTAVFVFVVIKSTRSYL